MLGSALVSSNSRKSGGSVPPKRDRRNGMFDFKAINPRPKGDSRRLILASFAHALQGTAELPRVAFFFGLGKFQLLQDF